MSKKIMWIRLVEINKLVLRAKKHRLLRQRPKWQPCVAMAWLEVGKVEKIVLGVNSEANFVI